MAQSSEVAGARAFVPGGGSCVFWARENGVSYWPFSVDRDSVLFTGTSSERIFADGQRDDCDHLLRGSFLWRNGAVERVGGIITQELHALRASIDDGLLAYVDADGAIYAKELDGAQVRLAGPGDPLPGRSEALAFAWGPTVAAGRVAFQGRDTAGREGVYLWEGGTLSILAEQGMALPDGRLLQRLSTFGTSFLLGDDRVAVFGVDSGGSLLYLASLDGDWERVIDGADVGISSSQDAGDFDGRQLLLEGSALYVIRADGSLLEILRRGGSLDGRRVSVLRAVDLRGDRLAPGIGFEGDSADHLYVAELPPLPVEIDVKPHRTRNRLHPRSRASIPVAILGSETFPVEEMDPASVRIGPAAAPTRGRPKLRDVNHDGWTDLVLRFRPRETGLARGDSELCLSGETLDGIAFEGCDTVAIRR